ncbi:MAG: phospholipase D-like domain-containing protein [Acidimicrobiales bacterium]
MPLSGGATRRLGSVTGVAGTALLAYQVARYKRATRDRLSLVDPPGPGSPEFSRLVGSMTGSVLSPANRVRVLRNGVTLESMLEAISGARQTVDLSSYIYWPGETADRFGDALVERARAGVEVNVLVDGYGSARLLHPQRRRLQRGGVNVAVFRPLRWYTLRKVNKRMHRRILVVDGRIGFAGGVGIADVWSGDAQDPCHWRETHLRIEGPAVADLFAAFAENWAESTGRVLAGPHLATFDQPVEPGEAGGLEGSAGARARLGGTAAAAASVQITRSTPTGGPTGSTLLFFAAIAGARRRLWLTTAYFVPDRFFERALCQAARRGVDVRLLINGLQVDKEVVRKAGQRSYARLLAAGIRIFEYDRTMLHAKVLIVDDVWANVGSGNFDSRSFDLDLELNAAIEGPELVAELEAHFTEDVQAAREITPEAWSERPWWRRMTQYATEAVRQSL